MTKLPDGQLERAVASGAISPHTTRDEVRAMRPRYNPIPLTPCDIAPERAPPLALVSSAGPTRTAPVLDLEQATRPAAMLHQIERLVEELVAEVERGEAVLDAAFVMSAQTSAEKLRAMADRYHVRRH